jgi:hypothetical protein
MKVFKIFTLVAFGLTAVSFSAWAQSKLSVITEPPAKQENNPALKIDTGSFSNDFVIKPRYRAHLGAPVEIPNGYQPSDDTVFTMPVAKINPVRQVILPTITVKKVTEAP